MLQLSFEARLLMSTSGYSSLLKAYHLLKMYFQRSLPGEGGGEFPIMAYTRRLRPRGIPVLGFRYI